jgi:hypothetical protein
MFPVHKKNICRALSVIEEEQLVNFKISNVPLKFNKFKKNAALQRKEMENATF